MTLAGAAKFSSLDASPVATHPRPGRIATLRPARAPASSAPGPDAKPSHASRSVLEARPRNRKPLRGSLGRTPCFLAAIDRARARRVWLARTRACMTGFISAERRRLDLRAPSP